MTPLDQSDLSGCTMCRLVETCIEDREDAVWRGDFAAASRLAELIARASAGVP
jgi:hypothetical protein